MAFLIFVHLTAVALAFPATQQSVYQIPINLQGCTVSNTTIEVSSSGQTVYIPILLSAGNKITLYQVNMTAASGTQIHTKNYNLPQVSTDLSLS
jgi:hypothetical protein